MTVEIMRILNYSLNPNFAYKHWIYDYYDSIYVENRQDIDCFKMFFLIKFKVFYNFINDNSDVNYATTSNCLNLTKVRDALNRFNDTYRHIDYKPILMLSASNRLNYQIIIWIILSLILLILTIVFIRYFSIEQNKIQDTNFENIVQKNIDYSQADTSHSNKTELEIKSNEIQNKFQKVRLKMKIFSKKN